MLFSNLGLKAKYDSDEDNILASFHMPLLEHANRYDRAVGYFSSDILAYAAKGLEKFILTNGKMRLIIGDPLSDSEYDAVMAGNTDHANSYSLELSELLCNPVNVKLKILTYLVANQQLEIKFALTHQGMFHKKVGIFYQDDQIVVFNGSANETLAGLTKYNSEEISAFFSWRDSFIEYGKPEIDKFNSLWEGKNINVRTFTLSSEEYTKIKSSTNLEKLKSEIFSELSSSTEGSIFFTYSFPKSKQTLTNLAAQPKSPCKPLVIKNKPLELFNHQINAISSWKNSNHQGLFKLATGAGKTFTSIVALIELYEERRNDQLPTFVIISVPYIELANQWVNELSPFNISPIKCFESSQLWEADFKTKSLLFLNKKLNFVCIVVVNKTLSSIIFQRLLNKIPLESMLFIGDECHHLGGQGLFESLPQCKYRIGLSATPFKNDEDEVEGSPFPDVVRQNLITYFKGIISEYSLRDAIEDGVLTPYVYDLVAVYLDDDEQSIYEDYSLKISKLIIKSKSSGLNSDERSILTNLCGARSRLLATCKGKLPALVNYIVKHPELEIKHSLIYVGEGTAPDDDVKYITRVTSLLFENNIRVAKFTSTESSNERREIMSSFKSGDIDALVAMKVLDEGIDVPICRSAFILASTRNPRQYIQRRGRVLRKAEGKSEAIIIDFVVLPNPELQNSASQNLRKAERERITDFMSTALNTEEINARIFELGVY
jgi:superfamily II DNA or RNA helicase